MKREFNPTTAPVTISNRNCVTHHAACACREQVFAEIKDESRRLKDLLDKAEEKIEILEHENAQIPVLRNALGCEPDKNAVERAVEAMDALRAVNSLVDERRRAGVRHVVEDKRPARDGHVDDIVALISIGKIVRQFVTEEKDC